MSDNPEKLRLDQLLVRRGDFNSREAAQRAIMAGRIRVSGQVADKAGARVSTESPIEVCGTERYVGRGGLKLEAALDAFEIVVEEKTAVDIGASTGGFTDCLLQRGARRVHALDVGRNQLHWKIRSDGRVRVREGLNCRFVCLGDIGEQADLCVIDISFISLTLVLPPAFDLLKADGHMIALIKPQFELARMHVGKGGIVRDPVLREAAISKIRNFVTASLERQWCGVIESPIKGAGGNSEFLAHLRP